MSLLQRTLQSISTFFEGQIRPASQRFAGLIQRTSIGRVVVPALILLICFIGLFPTFYTNIQIPLFRLLNSLSTGTLPFWRNFTELGNGYLLLCCFSWLILINPRVWATVIASVPVGAILSPILKNFFAMPRPAAVLDPETFNIAGHALTSFNSLPSGHTITVFTLCSAFVFALILVDRFPYWRNWIWGIGLVACLAGLSRVLVGAHWPLDVVLGAFIGIFAGGAGAILAHRFAGWRTWMENPRNFYIHILILALFCAGMVNRLPGLPLAWLVQHFTYVIMGLIAYQSRDVIFGWLAVWRSAPEAEQEDEPLPESLEPIRSALKKGIGKEE